MTRVRANPFVGLWPQDSPQRAFVDGVVWAYAQVKDATLFPSERDEAEAEAIRRFGDPTEPEPAPDLCRHAHRALRSVCEVCGKVLG
jgi:hypothetical protein